MKNKIMLITYADSFGKNLKELKSVLDKYFKKEISAVHVLPFYPSSGDRGFAPITYTEVDEAFGTWDDIEALAKDYELMFDFMINHLSKQSSYFQDFIEKHDDSEYKEMFLRFNKFWPKGEPTQEDIALLNKRKPYAPCVEIEFKNKTKEKIWCTFDEEQMDLNLESEVTWKYIEETLHSLMEKGLSMLRLDAFAFATKRYGTSCFFLEPETWEMMERIQKILDKKKIPMLPEIHDHYTVQQKISDHGYTVYDFALPVLVLHTLYTKNSTRLKHWLKICPKHQHTTLDTHDGIGTVDVKDLISEEELNNIIQMTEKNGANFKWDHSAQAKDKKVVYQINCTYYSALGERDDSYLLARAIQFFSPGVPQVYYMGLLAGENDYELMEKTNYPRNISRHDYTIEEIEKLVTKPVVQQLCKLMRFRNEYPVFDGSYEVIDTPNDKLEICWKDGKYEAILKADLNSHEFQIKYKDASGNLNYLSI